MAPNGDIYIVGGFSTIQFAGQTLQSDVVNNQFLAKLSASGQELWIKKLPSQGNTGYFDIIGATDTSVIIKTNLTATIDLGGGPLSSNGWGDAAFVAFSSAGVYQWGTTLTAPGDGVMWLSASEVSSLNQVVIAGFAGPGAVYQGAAVTNPANQKSRNWFGLAFDASTGALVWHHDFQVGDLENNNTLKSVAVGPQGDVYITGFTFAPISFGGPALTPVNWTQGFVAHLDGGGNWVDGGFLGDNIYPDQIEVGPGGEIIVSAAYDFYQLGGKPVPFQPGNVVFGVSGQYKPTWTQFMNEQISIDVDADGVGFVLGNNQSFNVGGTTFGLKGTIDLVAGKIGMDGAMKWYRQFGASGASVDDASPRETFRLQPDGKAIILFQAKGGPIDFGFGPLSPAASSTVGVVQLAM